MIVYDYPLNERVRTWLRMEALFDKTNYFIASNSQHAHHAALLSIFELVDVMGRPELRSDLIQELERQKLSFEHLRGNEKVDAERLETVLERLGSALADLHAQAGKQGQHIRDNEWLAGIKSRSGIPGGVCNFDLPGYHFWLNQPVRERKENLQTWLAPMLPIQNGVTLILELLRQGGGATPHVAQQGRFQLRLRGHTDQLLRLGVAENVNCVPEVSANKYAVNLRFMTAETDQKARNCDEDVAFELTFCSLPGYGKSSYDPVP